MTTILNNIPQGYKATALGVIPQEWEVKCIKDFGPVITGSTPPTFDSENYGGSYMFVSPADLSEDKKYITTTEKTLTDKGFSQARKIPKGSVLFTCIGSTIGKVGIASQDLATNQQINAVITDGEYLFYVLSLHSDRIRILANEQAVPIINKSDFERIKLAVPPLGEQRKIAEVLGVWDLAIAKQVQLVERLTQRKRALMQRLLTAKLRLPGFSAPWKKVKLREICNITTGKLDANAMESNGIYPFFTCAKEIYRINKYAFDTEALLISGNGEYVGYIHYCKGKFNAYQRTYVLDNFKANIFYVKYALQYHLPKRILQTKSNSNTPYIVIGTLQDMIISEPSIKEQTAIAEVLTAADREIELAQAKLELYRRQKRGLMQQLLPGKKRIPYL